MTLLASIEAFLISSLLTPIAIGSFGFGVWSMSMLLSLLAAYLLIDVIINQSKRQPKDKAIVIALVLAATSLTLALFLKG